MNGRPSVLLVDDKQENLTALEAVLEPLELDLVAARSGEQALKRLLEREFAVILLDVQMPDMDGFETAEFIKQRQRTRHIPIIFVTAISKEAHHVFRGYTAGAVDYVFKPYDPLVLRSKVAVFVELYQKTAALQASEERFRAAFADAPIGKALLSTDGHLLQANAALCEMLGYEQPGELLGRDLDALVHEGEVGRDREHMHEMLDGALEDHQAERRLLRNGGSHVRVLMTLSLTRDTDGSPLDFVLQCVDLTERRRAERERAQRVRERSARAEAEAVAVTVRKLQSITDAALAHLAMDDLLRELLGRIRDIFQVDRATILLVERRGGSVAEGSTVGPDGLVERGVRIPVSPEFADRIAKVEGPIHVEDLDTSDVANPLLRDEDVRSLLAVPLRVEGRVSGVLHIGTLTSRDFTAEDGNLLQLVADRAALAIEHARLYEREHGIVETLQRSLLPERLPQVPGIELAALYLPGGRRSEVGGDWYDVVPLEDGRLALVLGDVVGHGIEAAALMGRLRNALRAYVHEGHSPSRALTLLDEMVQSLEPGRTSTIACLVIEPDLTKVTYALAGHPPPLVVAHGGKESHYLGGDHGVPLGVLPENAYEEQTCELDPGSTLLLYTDGLVERRDVGIDHGFGRLQEAVHNAPEVPAELCDHVIAEMLGGEEAADDVAVLALQSIPITDQLAVRLPAEPKALHSLRATLGRWLAESGASEQEVTDIQLACHEACSNVIEHAYRFGDETVEVDAAVEDGEVRVAVRDRGHWREPRETNRGRGRNMMEALMDSVEVKPGKTGTTVEMRRRLAAHTPAAV